MPCVELPVAQTGLFYRSVAWIPRPSRGDFTDVGDSGMGRGSIEPNALDRWLETVFPKFMGFPVIDDRGHVGFLHW